MVEHAFGTLGLHRIALYVFEFNVRAIRAYQRCGFVIEGRSRESIWRDGRWWDESMSSRRTGGRPEARAAGPGSGGPPTGTGVDRGEPVGAEPDKPADDRGWR
jgi:hypothetical protein